MSLKYKLIIAIITILLIVFFFYAFQVKAGDKNYTQTTHNRFISIIENEDLYYDIDTHVVYIIFNENTPYLGYGYMSPYYATNGLPYIYNTETQELEEIKGE